MIKKFSTFLLLIMSALCTAMESSSQKTLPLQITIPTPSPLVQKNSSPSTPIALAPSFTQKDFENIHLVGFTCQDHFKGLCLLQYALEQYKGNSSPALLIQQKNIIYFLSCIKKENYCEANQLKLLALLTTLRNRANKNFVSHQFDITTTYNNIIDYFQTNVEKRLSPQTDAPRTIAQGHDDLDLVEPCNELAKNLERHYVVNSSLRTLQQFAVETINSLMVNQHEKKITIPDKYR